MCEHVGTQCIHFMLDFSKASRAREHVDIVAGAHCHITTSKDSCTPDQKIIKQLQTPLNLSDREVA